MPPAPTPPDAPPTDAADLAFYVRLHLKAEHVEEWRALLADVVDRMAQEDTFVSCTLHRSLEDATLFTLYERWREPSVEAFVSRQMPKPYRAAYEARLPDLLQSPRAPSITVCLQTWAR